jgi:D-alanyl-D-alanine carboxypeptidase (penicillin-binding protein 5/6)
VRARYNANLSLRLPMRLLRLIPCVALAAFASLALAARPGKHPAPPPPPPAAAPQATTSAAPQVAAAAWYLLDFASGTPIAGESADERRDPASLTKLMTAYLSFAALRDGKITPSQTVPVSAAAWKAEGSRMFIEPRRAVTVDELLRGMIVQSGNDASIALAEAVAGSEAAFVERMNAEAKRMGLANTRFENATGLSQPGHYSTARDLATLAAALIRDFPEGYALYSLREYRYNNITQGNRNRLLWLDANVDGVKTGHTDAAGWCLIASAKRGERRLLSVVLGAASDAARAGESLKLLNWGFQAWDTVQLYQSGKPVESLRVWKGAENAVAAGFFADQYLALPKGRAAALALSMTATEPLVAPVVRGQRVGTVNVALDGKTLAELPLVALDDVPSGNLLGRAWDTLRLWFR